MMLTLHELLHDAKRQLADGREGAGLDAEVLLAFVLGTSRSHLHAQPTQTIPAAQAEYFAALVARRAAGEPVAYLIGRREFWSLDFVVTPDTLIPRPETEQLVELALHCLPIDSRAPVADLGTGCGAIALAIAHERPHCRVIGTDIVSATLEVARGNAARLGIDNVVFRHGDWCAALAGERCALIVANPPYIRAADPHLHSGDLRFEPRAALTPGPEGLEAIRRIAATARAHLTDGGWLLLEHGYDQGTAVGEVLRGYGYHAVTDHADLAGLSRVAQARWSPRGTEP